MVNHMWHLAKYRLGLSTALGGTGMCIRTSIIREYGWDYNKLNRRYGIFHETIDSWYPYLLGA